MDHNDLYPTWPLAHVPHPMLSSSEEERYRYLQILTLLIDADDIILNEEIDFLQRMVTQLEMPNGTLGQLLKSVEQPSEDELRKALVAFFDRRGVALMVDLIMVAWSDEEFHPKERQFIMNCAKLLGVTLDQLELLLQLVTAIREEDIAELQRLLETMPRHRMEPDFLQFYWSSLPF
ncbi:MAG: TerB family tellurite resistance protein [bacterium]|jgi:uncharacterized tellurite resistance protein B-like protein